MARVAGIYIEPPLLYYTVFDIAKYFEVYHKRNIYTMSIPNVFIYNEIHLT